MFSLTLPQAILAYIQGCGLKISCTSSAFADQRETNLVPLRGRNILYMYVKKMWPKSLPTPAVVLREQT